MIELHLHLDGSIRVQTAWELAQEQHVLLGVDSMEELAQAMRVPEDCKTLAECLKRFDLPLLLLQKEDAMERVTFELVEDLATLGVTYAEIRFAPQLSTKAGLNQDEVVEAAIRGVKHGMEQYPSIRCGLILCCMRGADIENKNFETVETAKKYLGDVVCALDLAGAESLFHTELFDPIFLRAKEYGLPMTIHAGEADGPESIKNALEYGAKRIGHGISALEDPKLIQRLIDEKITLEMCVTSNYHTKVVPDISSHPIRKFFDLGVHVTVNSDNMTVSNTNINKEIGILKEYYQFTNAEIQTLQEYAKEASFLSN